MPIYDHVKTFCDLPVEDYIPGTELKDPSGRAYRVALSWQEADRGGNIEQKMESLLNEPGAEKLTHLVIGSWGEPYETNAEAVIKVLVERCDNLESLEALFVGEITMEESEISWIEQGNYTELLPAYPKLRHLRIRGGNNLKLGSKGHAQLESLVIESGGLSKTVIDDIIKSDFPSLTHLELWLGEDEYGGDCDTDKISGLITRSWPKLSYLGLCNSEIQDELAGLLANASIVEQLSILDLSKGSLTDSGAQKLLDSGNIKNLDKLDLHHHFMSDDMMQKFKSLDIKVDVSEQQQDDVYGDEVYRYIFVGE